MKILSKILLVMVIAICVSIVMPQNVSRAEGESVSNIVNGIRGGQPVSGANAFADVANRILSFLQIASGIAAVVVIAITGFRYIIETPEVKGELKKNMFPIIVGILLVFFAATIANFFIGIFSSANNG